MKLVLSRKGFDSGSGGFPNPILPSGRPYMLPIPDRLAPVAYRDIHIRDESLPKRVNGNLGTLIGQLTERRISPLRRAHLDPDLDANSLPRLSGWKPAFGQRGAALAHLQKQGVSIGDLFLFFGWFKQTEVVRGRLQYIADAPDQHVIFGWLQVGTIWDMADSAPLPAWLAEHPHGNGAFQTRNKRAGNVIFAASSELAVPSQPEHIGGAGIFPKVLPQLLLTKPGSRLRSQWQLPAWFFPTAGRPPLTYHNDPKRWTLQVGSTILQSVGRGQEFVLDCNAYPESREWLQSLWNL